MPSGQHKSLKQTGNTQRRRFVRVTFALPADPPDALKVPRIGARQARIAPALTKIAENRAAGAVHPL